MRRRAAVAVAAAALVALHVRVRPGGQRPVARSVVDVEPAGAHGRLGARVRTGEPDRVRPPGAARRDPGRPAGALPQRAAHRGVQARARRCPGPARRRAATASHRGRGRGHTAPASDADAHHRAQRRHVQPARDPAEARHHDLADAHRRVADGRSVRSMVAQIDTVLPEAGILRTDITTYCDERDRRITGCQLEAEGTTANGRDLKIRLDVDPGDLKTRTAPPSTNQNPVMKLKVEYVGDPRRGQVDRRVTATSTSRATSRRRTTSGLIWPRMDEDAPPTTALLNDWTAPLRVHHAAQRVRPRLRGDGDHQGARRRSHRDDVRAVGGQGAGQGRRRGPQRDHHHVHREGQERRGRHGQLRALRPRLLRDALLHAAGQELRSGRSSTCSTTGSRGPGAAPGLRGGSSSSGTQATRSVVPSCSTT